MGPTSTRELGFRPGRVSAIPLTTPSPPRFSQREPRKRIRPRITTTGAPRFALSVIRRWRTFWNSAKLVLSKRSGRRSGTRNSRNRATGFPSASKAYGFASRTKYGLATSPTRTEYRK